MQANRRRSCTLRQVSLLAAVMLSSSGLHAGTSSSTATQSLQMRLTGEAEQAAAQSRFTDAAKQYEALAAQTSGAARDTALLKAARNYQLAGSDDKAGNLLTLVGTTLSASNAGLRSVVDAAAELHAGHGERALAILDQIPLPLPDQLAADILRLRAEALFAIGRVVLAVNTAVERERMLKTDAALNQNRQLIWSGLKQSLNLGRDLTPPTGATRVTTGWLELAKLMNAPADDPFAFNRELDGWRSRYPGHEANQFLPLTTALPSARGNTIALLLPLTGKQAGAAQAIRDGFIAAALHANAHPNVQVVDTTAIGATQAYVNAVNQGADMVIGPLLKEEVDALAQTNSVAVPTIALNSVSDKQRTPALLFQFALNPEDEARLVARRAHSDGYQRAIMLTPNNDWGKRVQRSFTDQLAAQGDRLVDARQYDSAAKDYVNFLKQVFAYRKAPQAKELEASLGKRQIGNTRDDYDYIFIAAQPTQVKQLRPALRFVLPDVSPPIYATSDSLDPETTDNPDLNDTRIADMPWVINRQGDLVLLHQQLNALWGSSLRSRSRLYAFGIDAFRLSSWLRSNQASLGSTLQGATGLLALDMNGRVLRQLDWAQIKAGKTQLLGSGR